MLQFFRKLTFPVWTIPLSAVGLGLICYGVLIPWLGFYWDDLAYQYALHVFGPGGFQAFVSSDRPFSHYIYVITATLFGNKPIYYQVFNLTLRLLTAAGLWWLLRNLWPKRGASLAWAPLAFVVYPGFVQQPVSFIYNLHWINYLQTLLSLSCMIRAVRSQRPLLWTFSALLLAANIFSLEYSFGLELLRPLLLFLVIHPSLTFRHRLTQTLRRWLPYLGLNAAFLLWILAFLNNNRYNPIYTTSFDLPAWVLAALRDLFKVGVLPWLHLFDPLSVLRLNTMTDLLFWLVAAAVGVLLAFYLFRLRRDPDDDTFASQLCLVGVWTLVVAGLPLWGIGINPETRFPYDRLTMPFIAGTSLLLAGFLELFIRGWGRKVIIFSLIIALASGFQFINTNTYKREWANLPVFFTQMTWRAPGLKPGTILLTHNLPFQYYSDNSLSGALNMTYAPEQHADARMPYLLLYIQDRVGGSLPGLLPGLVVEKPYRSLFFSGNTSQALVFFYSPPGCLRMLDPSRPQEIPDVPPIYKDVINLSRLEQIIPEPSFPAKPIPDWFSAPREEGWCFYYQKADLARQMGQWDEVEGLGNEALAAGLLPAEPSELGVFIEAKARLSNPDGAFELTRKAVDISPSGMKFACAEWGYLQAQGLAGAADLDCPDVE
jgi:hypothetical protein